jgi:ribosome-binding factor A
MPGRRGRTPAGGSRYSRTARVNEVLREVVADAITRLADTDARLDMLTVTAVESDPDFRHARILFASLGDDARAGLVAARARLQAVIGREVRLKWTPQLSFEADPAIEAGERVEEIIREMRRSRPEEPD